MKIEIDETMGPFASETPDVIFEVPEADNRAPYAGLGGVL